MTRYLKLSSTMSALVLLGTGIAFGVASPSKPLAVESNCNVSARNRNIDV